MAAPRWFRRGIAPLCPARILGERIAIRHRRHAARQMGRIVPSISAGHDISCPYEETATPRWFRRGIAPLCPAGILGELVAILHRSHPATDGRLLAKNVCRAQHAAPLRSVVRDALVAPASVLPGSTDRRPGSPACRRIWVCANAAEHRRQDGGATRTAW